jgi:hypothetical protein
MRVEDNVEKNLNQELRKTGTEEHALLLFQLS